MAYTNIDDPSAYFQTAIWTGNATNRTIDLDSNSTMQPDFSWVKSRSNAYENYWQNSSSGTDKYLRSNRTSAEDNGTIVTYNSSGFGIGSGAENNQNSTTNVGWFWKANGGTTATNNDGDRTTTVQANTDAGFSIVTYLSNGSAANQTLGHGLGVAPDVIISKRRGGTTDWLVYHKSLGVGSIIYLNSTSASSTSSPPYKDTPTSTVFSTQNQFQATDNFISWCFAEKQGYSKFGKYVGNGNANGSFVYTGFAPAWVMIKDTSQATNWEMFDVKRNPSNVRNLKLGANLIVAENGSDLGNTSQNNIDILSNGFKMKTGNTDTNVSGDTYIYMAFAENPFVTSTGIPTTAR